MNVPRSHPRYVSLMQRERIVEGLEKGYVTKSGLIAQGRGEAFDYLLGERTTKEAKNAEIIGVALLLLAKNPVISVNGNVTALVPGEIVTLAKKLNAKLEINLFYWTKDRERLIEKILQKNGAKEILCVGRKKSRIPGIDSNRSNVNPKGIFLSDVVLVPLEDGDRTEALVKMKKRVIAIDLNPLSRTSQKATITIVDNIVRAIPNMTKIADKLKKKDNSELTKIVTKFDNKKSLDSVTKYIRSRVK